MANLVDGRGRAAWLALALVAALGACKGRSAGTSQQDATSGADAAPGIDAASGPDAGPPVDAAVPPDASVDPCYCTGGEVWRWHECVPTLELGCGPACDPLLTDCGQGYTCDPCGAATACDTYDCQPTCLPTQMAQGPVADPLRIHPTEGVAGQSHTITISGFPFYVGALFYLVRLDDELDTLWQQGGTTCSFDVELPARPPGMVSVWVSAYGGVDPWVLAGFFTYSGGVPVDCVQPGFPCGPTDECCSNGYVNQTCQQGRCR